MSTAKAYTYNQFNSYTIRGTMRLLPFLLSLALAPLALAAAGDGDSAKWVDLAKKSKNGIIKLDSAMYDELLASDREHSAVVLLTALAPQFKCQPCQ